MGFWGGFLLGFLIATVSQIFLFIFTPILEIPRNKIKSWIGKKPIIKKQKDRDKELLEELIQPLLSINQIPRFPDTPKQKVQECGCFAYAPKGKYQKIRILS